jgi:hypothetical protein
MGQDDQHEHCVGCSAFASPLHSIQKSSFGSGSKTSYSQLLTHPFGLQWIGLLQGETSKFVITVGTRSTDLTTWQFFALDGMEDRVGAQGL